MKVQTIYNCTQNTRKLSRKLQKCGRGSFFTLQGDRHLPLAEGGSSWADAVTVRPKAELLRTNTKLEYKFTNTY